MYAAINLGAGTFDVSFMKKNKQKLSIENEVVKCLHGGADVDKLIL